MRVKQQDLGRLIPLAEGGFGKVYRVDGYRLPGDTADLAYKEFTQDVDVQVKSAEVTVAFRAGLDPADQADLDAHAAWPRALVEDPSGAVTGLLMPLIPPEFFREMLDSKTGALEDKPCEIGWLATGAQQRAAAQLDLRDVEITERLILLGRLVYAIGRLHKLGWVFGDVSMKNAVFALDPPQMILLDCDGVARLSDKTRRQPQTPYWDPPEAPLNGPSRLQDDRTDVYKLGLAILRCLTPGQGALSARSPSRLADELDAEGTALVARALDSDPDRRPSARELYDYFYRVVQSRIQPPEILVARLRTPYRVRGQEIRIDWQVVGASAITVIAGSQRLSFDLANQPDGCIFRPDESGAVAIEVANRFGTLRAELGEVTLYELPPFHVDLASLPVPRLAALPEFPLDALDKIMATAPAALVPKLPDVPSLDTFGLVEDLAQLLTLTAQLPEFGETITEVSAAVAAALRAQAGQVGASLQSAYLASQSAGGSPLCAR